MKFTAGALLLEDQVPSLIGAKLGNSFVFRSARKQINKEANRGLNFLLGTCSTSNDDHLHNSNKLDPTSLDNNALNLTRLSIIIFDRAYNQIRSRFN